MILNTDTQVKSYLQKQAFLAQLESEKETEMYIEAGEEPYVPTEEEKRFWFTEYVDECEDFNTNYWG